MSVPEADIFDHVGGEPAFVDLVAAFYRGVESDPPLRALYPADLGPGKQRLAWFLMERFGGPPHFSSRHGHPRLRMRHMPFAVTPGARDAWMRHMQAALETVEAFAAVRDVLLPYFEDTATFMINRG